MLKNAKRLSLGLFVLLIVMGLASAAPPFVGTTTSNGLTIDTLIYGTIKQNSDFTLHIHVYNASNGLNQSNATTKCNVHLYNSTGNHIFRQDNMIYDGKGDWEVVINKGNFTNPGQYAIEAWCNNAVMGGSERLYFEVTPSGSSTNSNTLAMILLLLFLSGLFLILSFTLEQKAVVVRMALIIISILITVLAVNMAQDFTNTDRQQSMIFSAIIISVVSAVLLIFYITVSYIKSLVKAGKEVKQARDSDGLI